MSDVTRSEFDTWWADTFGKSPALNSADCEWEKSFARGAWDYLSIALSTEREMHKAWRKRAEEAEAASIRTGEVETKKFLGFTPFTRSCKDPNGPIGAPED